MGYLFLLPLDLVLVEVSDASNFGEFGVELGVEGDLLHFAGDGLDVVDVGFLFPGLGEPFEEVWLTAFFG